MKTEEKKRVMEVVKEVVREVGRASAKHRPLASSHEAYAVILEELDEYKEWVWMKESKRDRKAMREELVQVAAMAIRAVLDTTGPIIEGKA